MSRPLRIALINTFYPPYNFGGDGVYVRRLAHALARRGCDVHVLHDAETYKARVKEPFRAPSPLEEPAGVSVHRLESPLGPIASLITHQTGRPLAYGAALDAFFRDGFDVTHFHNVSLAGGPGILSRGRGVTLYTAHEHWLVCPTHILWRHNREVCDRRECAKCQIVHRRPPQLWRNTGFLERQAAHVDAFIALSRSSADNHRRFGFPREMRILPSFIPDEPVRPRSAPAGRPYALFAGRLEKIKGLQDLIPEFREREGIDLVIAGEGDFRGDLERLAEGAAGIRFLGRVPTEELSVLYLNAAAVVLPSVCLEVFPLVALEAFRAGVPIVARNLGPFPEIVETSGAGLLFDTPREAHAAVVRLAEDEALRQRLGARARTAFETHWSERAAIGAYFRLIAEIAQSKGLAEVEAEAGRLASI